MPARPGDSIPTNIVEPETLVPMPGSGELVDLTAFKTALKDMSDKDLTLWYVKYHKPLKDTVGLIRGEVIGRMVKKGSDVFHSTNGQRIELNAPPKRTCDRKVLEAVQERIKNEFGQDLKLFRIKETVDPAMSDINKARKLSMDIATAIAEGLKEEPGNPSIKIEGVDNERAKVFESQSE